MPARPHRALTACVAAFVGLVAANLAAGDEPSAKRPQDAIRVLIVTDVDRDSRATASAFRHLLAATGRFDVRVSETADGPSAKALSDVDVLVDGRAPDATVGAFVKSGKGLVLTPRAMASWSPQGTSSKKGAGPGDAPSNDITRPVHLFEVEVRRPEHPVVHGLKGRFRVADASYPGLTIPPGAEILARAKGDSPALLAMHVGQGRVFGTTLGHDASALDGRTVAAALARGVEWAATGAVTLPADLDVGRPDMGAVRALLVTGGHDHEASFYSLFDGYRDLAGVPVMPSAEAFKKDLRGKYDTVVMYDFSRDLDETGKRNLRDFVESGKGVVVLHHALLNYQDWGWWTDEIVGGSYRLKREGDKPSSAVKNGEDLFVSLGETHPAIEGLAPFHIVDETYRRMRFAPGIRPLLTTDNPESDPVLAWVGPKAGARVVAIQLGHGPSAFRHPSYRTLVHNAILWSAGRTK